MFICNLGEAALTALIGKVAPQCSECNYPMTQICVEECCQPLPLFCNECHKDRRFLHRTNELCILLLKDKPVKGRKEEIERLTAMLESLTDLKTKS